VYLFHAVLKAEAAAAVVVEQEILLPMGQAVVA
jgi:hypothetical protein